MLDDLRAEKLRLEQELGLSQERMSEISHLVLYYRKDRKVVELRGVGADGKKRTLKSWGMFSFKRELVERYVKVFRAYRRLLKLRRFVKEEKLLLERKSSLEGVLQVRADPSRWHGMCVYVRQRKNSLGVELRAWDSSLKTTLKNWKLGKVSLSLLEEYVGTFRVLKVLEWLK